MRRESLSRDLDARVREFEGRVLSLVEFSAVGIEGTSPEVAAEGLVVVQDHYRQLKDALLQSGTEGRVSVRELVAQLDRLSDVRRMAEQLERGARYLWVLGSLASGADNASELSLSATLDGVPTT